MGNIEVVIRNGHIIDPFADVDHQGTIAIADGKSLGLMTSDVSGRTEIDASGCYVFPGLIDFHTHIYYRGSSLCVDPNSLLAMGVTTAVDAGTSGCSNFYSFYNSMITHSSERILAFLNVCSYGQPGDGFEDDLHPQFFQPEKIRVLMDEYAGVIRGLKIRMSRELLAGQKMEPLVRAKEIACELKCPIVVHASNPPVPESEMVSLLEKGDVLCHCFHGKGMTILDENGRVNAEIIQAKERGVLFDCANGSTNYNHAVARAAIAQGFLPDIISTDMCSDIYNRGNRGKSLPYVMSKYLCLGMSLSHVVRAVTATPAHALGLDGVLGTLARGAAGDVTICKCQDAAPVFEDHMGETMIGDKLLVPVLTIKSGRIWYRQTDF